MLRLTLLGRHGCHLCDVMQQELEQMLAGQDYELCMQDVDSRGDWRQQYGHKVPVLLDAEGNELCHYHLNERSVMSLLSREG